MAITSGSNSSINLIYNYIYIYHIKDKTGKRPCWCVLPGYPEQISDSTGVSFNQTSILGRSAPIFTYSHSGPRSISFDFKLHRDMFNDINHLNSNFDLEPGEDIVDAFIKNIQAIALPRYTAETKSITPPFVALRIGEEIFIKGIVNGEVNVTYMGAINAARKYTELQVNFRVDEVDPYDADSAKLIGSFRGFDPNIQSEIFK